MRMINFARRNFKELIRDPLSLVFEIALPIFLLFIFQQIKIPGDTYKLEILLLESLYWDFLLLLYLHQH